MTADRASKTKRRLKGAAPALPAAAAAAARPAAAPVADGQPHAELQHQVELLQAQLAARHTDVAALQGQLAALQADMNRRDVADEVAAAIAAGRLNPMLRDWALLLGQHDVEQLRAFLRGASPVDQPGVPA